MSLSAKSFYGNDFDLHENETACKTHFHMKGFALRLILKQRRKRTLKWPITQISDNIALVKYPSQFSHSGVGDCSMYRVYSKDPRVRTFIIQLHFAEYK